MIAHAAPVESTTETCTVLGDRPPLPGDVLEQAQPRGLPVGGHVEMVAAVAQDLSLHVHQPRDIVVGPRAAGPVAEQGQQRSEDGAADRRWRVGAQLPGSAAQAERGAGTAR